MITGTFFFATGELGCPAIVIKEYTEAERALNENTDVVLHIFTIHGPKIVKAIEDGTNTGGTFERDGD